jgi:hypothetical protein
MHALRSQPGALTATLCYRSNRAASIPAPLFLRFHNPAPDSSAAPLSANNRHRLGLFRFRLLTSLFELISLPASSVPSAGRCSRRRIDLRWRRAFADRLRFQLGEDRPQGLDARRERVTIVAGDVGKLSGQSGGFFVG